MKKKLAGILAGMMVGSMLLSGTCMAAEDVIGEWYLTVMKMGDTEFNAADMGMEATLTVLEDGTAQIDLMGDITELTWSESDTGLVFSQDGEDIAATVEDGILTLADGEGEDAQVMEFSQEKPEKKEQAPVIKDAALEDFDGTWQLDTVVFAGMRMTAEQYEAFGTASIQMTIKDGTITYSAKVADDEDTIAADFTVDGVFEDGMLTAGPSEETGYRTLKLQLHEDGTLTDGYTEPALEEAEAEIEEEIGEIAGETEAENTDAEDTKTDTDDSAEENDYMIFVKAE